MSEKITIITNPDKLTPQLLRQVAVLYAQVFAPPPWNEAYKCGSCQTFYGLDQRLGQTCQCGGLLGEAYPLESTIQYIQKDAQRLGFVTAVLDTDTKTAGFAWSYVTDPRALISEKWADPKDQNLITEALSKYVSLDQPVRYFAECGVAPQRRGFGLSNGLTQAMLDNSLSTVYRTNCQSPMMAVASRLGFFQVYGPTVNIDRIQQTILDTGTCLFRENQNSQRVLFIKNLL